MAGIDTISALAERGAISFEPYVPVYAIDT
jgi:hypothetical protein